MAKTPKQVRDVGKVETSKTADILEKAIDAANVPDLFPVGQDLDQDVIDEIKRRYAKEGWIVTYEDKPISCFRFEEGRMPLEVTMTVGEPPSKDTGNKGNHIANYLEFNPES